MDHHAVIGRAAAAIALLWALTVPLVLLAGSLGPIGLATDGAQWFDNVDPDSPPFDGDLFGVRLASGDFNGDGSDDLATAAPLDLRPDYQRNGSVVIRYGVPRVGLAAGLPGLILRPIDSYQGFGWALAAGDFNGDSFDDLVVGSPYEAVTGAGKGGNGVVRVFYGSAAGLQASGYEVLDQAAVGAAAHYCTGPDQRSDFGTALAVGNFDGDAYADLAIGSPSGCEATYAGTIAGGAVFVAHGGRDGLLPFHGLRITQDSHGIYDDVEEGDRFGQALAADDFNHDGHDDLAIGIYGENGHGAIDVVMGGEAGLVLETSVFWLPGALGEDPERTNIGWVLASGDFDGDGFADLAVGMPDKDVDDFANSGGVDVAYGAPGPNGFDLSRTDRLWQGLIYPNGNDDWYGDYFGWSLAAGDFDGDGRDDLAVGHPGEDWPGQDRGAVTILMGDVPTLGATARFHLIGTGWEGVPGDPSQLGEQAGTALAVGDFDGSGRPDLVIGVPYHDSEAGGQDAGAEVVLYTPGLLSDGFESGATDRWSELAP